MMAGDKRDVLLIRARKPVSGQGPGIQGEICTICWKPRTRTPSSRRSAPRSAPSRSPSLPAEGRRRAS